MNVENGFDLDTGWGRFKAYLDFLWSDHAYLRLGFKNENWLDDDLVRSNQPWPFQLEEWKARGIRTVINLRGGTDAAAYALEKEACERIGLTMVSFPVKSRKPLTKEQVLAAQEMFASIQYPALMHCKSGADRAGVMSALYCHLKMGKPVEEALEQLSFRHLHIRESRTGVLCHMFKSYLRERANAAVSFVDWITGPTYCPVRIKADFRPQWWGTLLTEGVIRRE